MTWAMLKKYPNLYYFGNDLDNDVANLWYIMQDEKEFNKLYEAVELCPYHQDIYKTFANGFVPKNNIDKALQFLYLSNYSLYGFGRIIFLLRINIFFNYLKMLITY